MNTATSTIERFYRDHHPAILKLVTRRVGDSHLAEDITADIFALALRSLTQGVEPRDPRAWLATIAANRVTTHWRSHRHHREVLTGDVEDTSTAWGVTPQPGPEDVAVHRESATELSAYHNHIVARIAQIGTPAAVMGCGTGTVKSTTHRALTLLRAALTSEVTA